jgi:hypothetical protein
MYQMGEHAIVEDIFCGSGRFAIVVRGVEVETRRSTTGG